MDSQETSKSSKASTFPKRKRLRWQEITICLRNWGKREHRANQMGWRDCAQEACRPKFLEPEEKELRNRPHEKRILSKRDYKRRKGNRTAQPPPVCFCRFWRARMFLQQQTDLQRDGIHLRKQRDLRRRKRRKQQGTNQLTDKTKPTNSPTNKTKARKEVGTKSIVLMTTCFWISFLVFWGSIDLQPLQTSPRSYPNDKAVLLQGALSPKSPVVHEAWTIDLPWVWPVSFSSPKRFCQIFDPLGYNSSQVASFTPGGVGV